MHVLDHGKTWQLLLRLASAAPPQPKPPSSPARALTWSRPRSSLLLCRFPWCLFMFCRFHSLESDSDRSKPPELISAVRPERIQAAVEERKEGASLPLRLRWISVHPAVSARPPDQERRRSRGGAMKITTLLMLKPSSSGTGGSSSTSSGDGSGLEALVLANATDVSHFGYFQRNAARKFIVFVARTVAQRTPPGQRQSI